MLDLKGRKIGDVSQHEGAVSLGPNRVATQSVRLSDVLGTCWTIRTNFDDILDDYLPEWTKYEVVAQMYEGHYIARVASLRAPHPRCIQSRELGKRVIQNKMSLNTAKLSDFLILAVGTSMFQSVLRKQHNSAFAASRLRKAFNLLKTWKRHILRSCQVVGYRWLVDKAGWQGQKGTPTASLRMIWGYAKQFEPSSLLSI